MLMPCCITRRVGLLEHSAHVKRIRHTNKLGESRIQWRDPYMHVPLGKIRHQFQEGCCHPVAHRLGLYLGKTEGLFVLCIPICACTWSPGYRDRANVMSFGVLRVDQRVVISCDLTARLESCLP